MTAHREILYGPLNGVLGLDIFRTLTAISVHLAAFHLTLRTKYSNEVILTDVLCILTTLDLGNFQRYCIVLKWVKESSRRVTSLQRQPLSGERGLVRST